MYPLFATLWPHVSHLLFSISTVNVRALRFDDLQEKEYL